MLARICKAKDEREEGFTLIELLVVMIIIGILAAIAIPVFLNQRNSGYDAAAKSDVKNGSTAEESFFVDNGFYTNNTTAVVTSGTVLATSGLPGYTKSNNTQSVTFTPVTNGYMVVAVSKSNKSFCDNSTTPGGVVAATSC